MVDMDLRLPSGEGDSERIELALLARAEEYSRAFVLGGVLLDAELAGDPTSERLDLAVDALSQTTVPDVEDAGYELTDAITDRTRWAYRIGLMTGLRLARSLADREPASKLVATSAD